jgi:PEP-CTERM motif
MNKLSGFAAVAGLALLGFSTAPAKAVIVDYTITFNGPGGGSGTLVLNETSLGNENENSINAQESFSGTVDGHAITINSSNIGNGGWHINLSGGTFNNLGITSNNDGVTGDAYLATSGGNGYALHRSGEGDLISFANFSIAVAVPEPSTWAMMILGFLGLGFMAVRKNKKKSALSFA